ncbi:MAG: hypothetical protein GW794_13765, partial [Flavobacteriales bacterium]|nr:hypothetical protein [Flavobacteriales bacterium]
MKFFSPFIISLLIIAAPFSVIANHILRTDSIEIIDSTSFEKTLKDEKGNDVFFVDRFDLFMKS